MRSLRNFLILFLIWPFMSFVVAITNYKNREARPFVYIYIIYFGFTFYVGQTGMDSARYVDAFLYNATLPISDFFNALGGLYNENTVDILEPLISFIVSRFTLNYSYLFASYAALFGIFYLKSIQILFKEYTRQPSYNALVYFIFFIFIIPVTSIFAPRMWIAAWMFFLGASQVVIYGKGKYLLVALSACLMHWSFILLNLVLLIYYFIGNLNKVYFPLVLLSFILPNILLPVFNWASLNTGTALQLRYSGYSSDHYIAYVQEAAEQLNWYVQLSRDLIYYYLLVGILLVFLTRKEFMKGGAEKNLFSFLLLLLSFVNFGSPFPDFGRFRIVFMLFATFYMFLYFVKKEGSRISYFTYLGIIPMVLYVLVDFRIGSDVINAWILLPLFGVPFFIPGIPLSELLFNL